MKTRLLFFAVSFVSLIAHASAQASLDWTSDHFGGQSQSDGTKATCIAAVPSGGVVVGYTTWNHQWVYPNNIFTDLAADIVRWSADGQKLWTVRIPGMTAATALAVDSTGAILFSSSNSTSCRIDCLDANGAMQWHDTITGSDFLRQLAVAPNGDVVAAGTAGATMSVARWTSGGVLQWMVAVPPYGNSGGMSRWLGVDAAGNSYVAGAHYVAPVNWTEISKLDPAGGVLWTYSISGNSAGNALAAFAPDGDVIFGYALLVGGLPGINLTRLAPDGSVRWSTSWTVPGGIWQFGDVEVGLDGSVWVLGVQHASGFPQVLHLLVRSFTSSGAPLGSDIYDPPDRDMATAVGLVRGGAGQMYAVASVTIDPAPNPNLHTETLAIQYDANGARNWVLSLDAYPFNYSERMAMVVLTSEHQLAMAGSSCGSCNSGSSGLVIVYDVNESPQAYCTGKTNSLGCVPASGFTGISSAAATSGFSVRVTNERNLKPGLLLYSVNGPAAVPFQGGTLCLQAPVKRGPAQSSGGSPAGNDCSGSYSLDLNAFAHGLLGGNPHPALLAAGTIVWCQVWGRDPGFAPPDNSSLSNGLRYVVLP